MTKLGYRFFFQFYSSEYLRYVLLISYAKIQLKISSGSGEEVDFVVVAIFCNNGHLGYST